MPHPAITTGRPTKKFDFNLVILFAEILTIKQ
jgi:hypothetical protein